MASVQVLICLLGLVVMCHSTCLLHKLEITDLHNPPNGCVDKEGTRRAFGDKWVTDCMECSCTQQGISCCNKMLEPGSIDIPEECELVVNKEACYAKVVLKSDKTKECNPV
ncbi:beta-microseminoprotein [Thalassophryne amazonica]|uniref:beta-microseminoprotein n=1 Tax=Thalassophryne amazonica TaxID=390379 RepID=UPI00147153A8|nr:beta-microseminoprotein [Thalassophryne amazonica]